jgi:hypothetical protein
MEAGKKGETGKNERKGESRNTRLTYQKWVQTAAAEALRKLSHAFIVHLT